MVGTERMRKTAGLLVAAAILAIFGFRVEPVQAQSPASENPCPLSAQINAATSSAIVIPHGGMIRICYYSLSIGLNATTTAQLVWGTGATCATGTVDSSPLLQFGTAVTAANVAITAGNGFGFIDESPSRDASDLCIKLSGVSPEADGIVKYGRY